MNAYTEYISNKTPYITRNRFLVNEITVDTATLRNPKDAGSLPEIYTEDMKKAVSLIDPSSVSRKKVRMVLCSNDINRIRKTALLTAYDLMMKERLSGIDLDDDDLQPDGMENCIDPAEFDEDYDPDYDNQKMSGDDAENEISPLTSLAEVSLSPRITEAITSVDLNLHSTGLLAVFMDASDLRTALFTGLCLSELSKQIEAISCLDVPFIFVAMPPELSSRPEVQQLLHERDFEFLTLSGESGDYYGDLFDALVEAGGLPFENEDLKTSAKHAILSGAGKRISEEYLASVLSKAAKRCKNKKNSGDSKGEDYLVLTAEHFSDFVRIDGTSEVEKLQKMVGLEDVKKVVTELCALHHFAKNNPSLRPEARHMLFVGNPGTGKTTGAKLLSDILAANGITNGIFLAPDRSRLIGNYVGQTAPKISSVFEEAKGGILFVDEAGFFLNKESGGFVDEAMKEFIRYMELYRDEVIVIFALYSSEVKDFLALDAGLTSRIARTIHFKDYTNSEMTAIFKGMLAEKKLTADTNVITSMQQYMAEQKNARRGSFGNARELRKLTDALVLSYALRQYEKKGKASKPGKLLSVDMDNALKTLSANAPASRPSASFGFGEHRNRLAVS